MWSDPAIHSTVLCTEYMLRYFPTGGVTSREHCTAQTSPLSSGLLALPFPRNRGVRECKASNRLQAGPDYLPLQTPHLSTNSLFAAPANVWSQGDASPLPSLVGLGPGLHHPTCQPHIAPVIQILVTLVCPHQEVTQSPGESTLPLGHRSSRFQYPSPHPELHFCRPRQFLTLPH